MHRLLLPLALAAAVFAGGCSTPDLPAFRTDVTVRTEPEGAIVRYRGLGRASFRWITAPTATPTTFEAPYGRISVYAAWPDGTKSEHVEVPLSMWRGTCEVLIRKSGGAEVR